MNNLLPLFRLTCYPSPTSFARRGSRLTLAGSRLVAGWVAGSIFRFGLTYAILGVWGSRGSNLYKNFAHTRKNLKEAQKHVLDKQWANLLPLLPPDGQ